MRERRSLRLCDFDYASAGAYFVTICTWQRLLLFDDPRIIQVVNDIWLEIPHHLAGAETDQFVVMPNHVHGIVWIVGATSYVGSQHAGTLRTTETAKPASLATIVRSFKSAVTNVLHRDNLVDGPVWQRNYYEHIIRDDAELARFREYIRNNPMNWPDDEENPSRSGGA